MMMEQRPASNWFVHGGRLRSGWRVGLYILIYFVGLLIVQSLVLGLYAVYMAAQGAATPAALLATLQPERLPIWLYLALEVVQLAILVPLTWVFVRLLDRRRFVDLGFHLEWGWGWNLALGLALGGTLIGLVFGVEWGAGWLAIGGVAQVSLARLLLDNLAATALFVLVAWAEELMFRGYIQVNLGEGTGVWPGLVLTSLIFGLFHALNPNFQWLALLNIALAGLSLGYGRRVTGNLWLPMAYHFGWNFFQGVVFSLPVSGMRYAGLLEVTTRNVAPFLTGAAFGPEGGLVATLVLLLSFPVLWLWGRWRREREAAG
jgi:membrane protease YdiL (CAAX protease family)